MPAEPAMPPESLSPGPAPGLAAAAAGDDDEPFDAEAFFNPYSGPPDGEDAWLAQVASPVADEYLASQQVPPATAREVLAAGFTHRDHEQGARGWAAGGALDTMEPGPVLAGFADDAISDGLPALTDDELIGVLGAARRLASRAAGIELAAVADLNARREAHAAATGDRRQAEHVADELAVALTLTCRSADKLLGLATGVTRLPAVLDALAAGRIDLPKAGIYALELAGLADEPAAAIAAVTIGDAAGMTTGELGGVLRRLVLARDPEAARKRRKKAERDARVEAWAENRGTAALAGRDLPPADVLAADKRIDAAARELKKAGATGTLEQLRAKVFLALLTSRPLYTLLPGNEDPDPHGGAGHPAGPGPATGPGGTGPAGSADGPRPGPGPGSSGGWPGTGGLAFPAGLTGSVNLTVPLSTWLGLTAQPGEAAGHGPLDAATSRDLASQLAAQPGSQWCLTVLDPAGRAIGHGCARTGPPGQRAGPAPPSPPGGASPPGDAPLAWLAGVKISWLEAGSCAHRRETRAYQPSNLLRHLIKIRDRTCSFPGCRRPARRCDDDHTIPHDQGGRTCECNLSPLCRRHHAAKQAQGWHLEQPRPGHLIWTLPSGRTRTVTPRPYPA